MPKTKKPAPKRKAAQEFDRTSAVPLTQVLNFGPVTRVELESVGIMTLDQIEDLGFEETARRWVEKYPERLNVNAFIGIVATLDGVSWTRVNSAQKAKARALVNKMRAELGLPFVKANDNKFVLKSHGVGKYGRCLGELFVESLGEVSVQETLISEGHGVAYFGGKR